MDEVPYGVIEIVLGFGALLAWAVWEVRKNRRALADARAEAEVDAKGD